MRTEKFIHNKDAYDNDDIKYAFEYNGLSETLPLIDVIVAEVCGENEEYEWYWILQMKDGTFAWASGGCDYTGWDCRSWVEFKGEFTSATDALEALQLSNFEPRKGIKECLLGQLNETVPFACFTPEQE